MVRIKVVNKSNNMLPQYSHPSDAGCDVRAFVQKIDEKFLYQGAELISKEGDSLSDEKALLLRPGSRALIPSGISTEIPEGYEIQVRARSGLALKYGISIPNGLGTIDSHYRGDIGLILQNNGEDDFIIYEGDRIGQFVLNSIEKIEWVEVEELNETDRGKGGYGHTGKQ